MSRSRAPRRAVAAGGLLLAVGLATGATGQSPSTSAAPAGQRLWSDATAEITGSTAGWTNKVEVADIDGDGLLDILHANGGDYDTPGQPEPPAAFLNGGPGGSFTDATERIFGDARFFARVIKARDVTADGVVDLLVGTTYQTQSRLLRGLGGGDFEDVTELLLPQVELSVGDLEVGDVDGDQDTDIVLADWGPGSPMNNTGGPVRLWRNSGEGWLEDVPAMPATAIGFSWDLELVDVDMDWDLDVAVSCKVCPTSRLYLNDGSGEFTDVTAAQMPASSNNYEFEAMDLDGDGDPELSTINDGPPGPFGLTEHVLRNDGGTFVDATAEWWPREANPGYDDNIVAFLDADSDGDADFLIGSLDGPDRLLVNDGSGHLVLRTDVFHGPATPGTLGLALGDLNDDGRLDVVEGEGEVAADDHVFLATGAMPTDTAGPFIGEVAVMSGTPGSIEVQARIHDRKTPVTLDDFRSLTARFGEGGDAVDMTLEPYGDSLWRGTADFGGTPPEPGGVTVCAIDRTGNETCVP